MDTICDTADVVTPRLLSLFCFALAYTRTQPNSPGYYVTVLQDKRLKASGPPNQKRSRGKKGIRIIEIQFPEGVRPNMPGKKG